MVGKTPSRHTLWLLSALLLGAAPGALSQAPAAQSAVGNSATATLLDKAHTLEARGRMDMAAQTWQQVLLADPNNTDALGGLARAAKMAGNDNLANTYLTRLKAINPNDPGIVRAQGVMQQGQQLQQLQQAGKFASAGNYAQAMNIYRQVFGSTPPPGDWALAYYETEAATEDGRAHAIAGLRSLVDKYPIDSRYQIALGRILTYNPKTRAEGRRYLERHPNDPQAAEALKQSLVWDAQNPATSGDIKAYLQKHRDPQLQEALQNTQAQQRASQRTTRTGRGTAAAAEPPSADVLEQRQRSAEENAAYAALNKKQYTEAEERFKALLAKNPDNPRALAGMGYVRMNQQNFGGAISFLEQAKQDGATGLDANLATSRYYYLIQEGGTALNENDLTTAEQQYRQALALRPTGTEAMQGLGGTLMKAQQPEAAVGYYAAFVKAKPNVIDGWRGLFMAEYQSGNPARALDTEKRIPASIRTQLMRDPDFLRTLASAYSAVGRDADAQRVLRSALDLPFPAGAQGLKAETQLQYASLLLQANHMDQASGLYRQVLASDPSNTLAWQGLINTQHSMHNDAAAIQSLESMPPQVYDQALRDPGFLGTAASIYQSQNKFDIAQSLLERAIAQQQTTGQKVPVPLQVELAGLYLQRNDAAHAFPIYQRVLNENPDRVDAWQGLLTSLHAAGRDREALAQIQQIPAAARHTLEGDVDYLQTVGNIYNGLGQPQQAMVFLNRVQQRYAQQHTVAPADIDIQNAWLLYNGSNDVGLYRQLLVLGGRTDLTDDQRRTVQTIWANWAVRRANQASAANNPKRALAILNAAAKAFPDNPGVIRALAGGYLRAGLPKEAVAIFKSQDMTTGSASDYKAAVGAALAANDNKDAEVWLRYGLNQYPKDGQMLGLAAKFEQARGDSGRAADFYKASLAAMPPADPGSELAYLLNQPSPLNPRALPTQTQSQDLTSLLAPGAEDRNTDGSPSVAQAPPRPYLPSATNSYGQAPVQIGAGAAQANPGYSVPTYMSNPAAAATRTRTTPQKLRDYVPDPQTSPANGYQIYPGISENYAPPAISGQAPVSLASNTMTEADLLPVEQADSQPYLSFQQEQIRRMTDTATRSQDEAYQPYRPNSQREGAQTGEFNGEVYGPYVPYTPPSAKSNSTLLSYSPSEVTVPTGATPRTIGSGTNATTRNAKNTRVTSKSGSVHPEIAAAEAAAARRRQSDPNSGTAVGQNNEPDDLTYGGQNVQYSPSTGQMSQPSSIPATAPTGQYGSTQNGRTGYSTTNQSQVQSYSNRSLTLPNVSQSGDSYGQQYPQPQRGQLASGASSGSRTTRATTRSRGATAVGGFGVAQAPVYYPSAPTGLTTQPYPDLPPYNNSGVPPSDQQLVARNIPPLRGSYSLDGNVVPGGPPLTERQQTELDLATLEASYSAWMGGSGFVRFRNGTPGVNRLFDYEAPFEATVVVGKSVRFSVVPRAVFLNSGTLDLTQFAGSTTATPILGTLPITAINAPTPQFASGVGGEIQAVGNNFGVAVGYTPYEFLVSNITARARVRFFSHLTLFAERDSVKDTQLSYAGLRDPGSVTPVYTGNIWGGVMSTGGGARLDFGNERSGFYVSGDGATLTGYHVLDNKKYEGTMGAYFRVKQWPGIGSLNVGGSFFAMHYDHNELPLTYGNGGYFSPEVYFLGSLPVTFTGNYKTNWHYVISAAFGIQTFEQDTGLYYPLDPVQQNGAYSGCSLTQIAQNNCPTAQVAKSTSTGANFNLGGEFSYRFGEHWYLGGALAANNTNNYTMVQPTFFARYLFRPQYPTEDYPTGLFPIEGFRPLRVP
jgi:predicted Zn-dependent protease